MKNLLKFTFIFIGVLIGAHAIASFIMKLNSLLDNEEDKDVDYVNYDDLECIPGINGVSLTGDDDIDIDVE